MKRILLFAGLSAIWLTAGAGSCIDQVFGIDDQHVKTITVQTVIDACDAFQLALQGATVAGKAGALPATAVSKIDALVPPVQNICPPKGQMPEGPINALVIVVTNTAAIIAASKEH